MSHRIFILFLNFLLYTCYCQVGGGNPGASPHDYDSHSDQYQPDEYKQSESSENSSVIVIIMILVFAVIAYFSSKNSKKIQKQRKIKIEKTFSQFEGENQGDLSDQKQDKISQDLQNIESNRWQIRYQNQNASIMDDGPVKFSMIQKKGRNIFKFQHQIHDNYGRSQGSGVFVFCKSGIKIIFEKTYDHRSDAGQTGPFDLLIYSGNQVTSQKFKGVWAFQGHEDNAQFNGIWQLIKLDK